LESGKYCLRTLACGLKNIFIYKSMTADNHCKNPNLVNKSFLIWINICNIHSLQHLLKKTTLSSLSRHSFEINIPRQDRRSLKCTMAVQAAVGLVKAARKQLKQLEKEQPWQRWQPTRLCFEKLLPA
jgi:hypothetical protein